MIGVRQLWGSSLAAKLNKLLHLAFKDYRATYGLFIFGAMPFGSNSCASMTVIVRKSGGKVVISGVTVYLRKFF